MCTIGGLGRHIGRQSTDISVDYRSAIDRPFGRQSTDSRPIFDRYIDRWSTNASPDIYTFIGRLSADASAGMCTFVGRLSADISVHCRLIYRSTIDRQSVDCRPIVDLQSVDSRPIVGRQSTDISADMQTEATYSTHDPFHLYIFFQGSTKTGDRVLVEGRNDTHSRYVYSLCS